MNTKLKTSPDFQPQNQVPWREGPDSCRQTSWLWGVFSKTEIIYLVCESKMEHWNGHVAWLMKSTKNRYVESIAQMLQDLEITFGRPHWLVIELCSGKGRTSYEAIDKCWGVWQFRMDYYISITGTWHTEKMDWPTPRGGSSLSIAHNGVF